MYSLDKAYLKIKLILFVSSTPHMVTLLISLSSSLIHRTHWRTFGTTVALHMRTV